MLNSSPNLPPPSQPGRLPFYYGWVVVAVAFVTMGIGVNIRTAFSLLFPPILDEFGWSRSETAATFSIGFLASTLITPLLGAAMDRLGPRWVVPMGATVVSAGLMLATATTQPWHLFMTLGLMVVGSAIIVLCLAGQSITTTTGRPIDASTGAAIRYGVFTTVSIATTTGYCTADFNTWPFLAKAVLILLMFIGGSAGSTAGGIKVIRIWIAFKVILSEIERVFRPSVVRPVRVGSTTIDDELKLATLAYVVGIVILFVLGSGAVMLLEQWTGDRTCDYTTAASASIASLFTIGPGLAMVGAIENYGWMSSPTKLVLCLLMALGRLEVFAIIVLFTPRFWRGD